MLNSSYKFYLALENSVCQDYVTEKFFKLLQYNVIPGTTFLYYNNIFYLTIYLT